VVVNVLEKTLEAAVKKNGNDLNKTSEPEMGRELVDAAASNGDNMLFVREGWLEILELGTRHSEEKSQHAQLQDPSYGPAGGGLVKAVSFLEDRKNGNRSLFVGIGPDKQTSFSLENRRTTFGFSFRNNPSMKHGNQRQTTNRMMPFAAKDAPYEWHYSS